MNDPAAERPDPVTASPSEHPFHASPQPLTFRAAALPPHAPLPEHPAGRVAHLRRGTLLGTAFGSVAASMARLTTVALFIITFLVQPTQIPSSSMEPTLLVGDLVLVNKQVFADPGRWGWLLPYRSPRVDDMVVFHYPVDPNELLVKRVVALGGDRLHLLDNTLYRNGIAQQEPWAQYVPAGRSPYRDRFPNLQEADPSAEAAWWIELRNRVAGSELPVPLDRYFVMGDNRNNSQDSRYWGFVRPEQIVGEPLATYFSLEREPGERPRLRRERLGKVLR